MKKTLIAAGILMALAVNTQSSFAVCRCPHKHTMKKVHHVHHYIKKSHKHRGCPCPTGFAAPCKKPCTSPCACPVAAPCPCPTTNCAPRCNNCGCCD